MKNLFNKILKKESGQALVITALVMVGIMGFAALAVDVGSVAVAKAELQNAADAAALAGAHDLPTVSDAVNAAEDYAELNGAETTMATTPYNGDSTKIEVVCSKTVEYTFARILGFDETDVSVRAVAQKTGSAGAAFGYALFSGSTSDVCCLNGADTYVEGSVHANYSFYMNGAKQEVTGSVEAVNTVGINGIKDIIGGICQAATIYVNGNNVSIGGKVYSAAPYIEMPDFSDAIEAEAAAAGLTYTGNKVYNGSSVNVDSSIYVNGNIYVNGSSFRGQGAVMATGDIIFNGSSLFNSTSDSVCFYSENGSIYINGGNSELHGLVYAPKGNIIFNGSHQTVYGRVIGYRVYFNGSNANIISGDNDLACLSETVITLVE